MWQPRFHCRQIHMNTRNREGPDGDKWSKTTQETLGGSDI